MTTKITKLSAKFYTTLSKKVNIADVSATLSSASDLDGDTLPSGRYGFTIDEGNSSVEYVEADLVGTALTGIKGIDPTTLAETTGFVKEHRAGAEVKITDFTVLARLRNVLLGVENLDDGAPIKYGSSPTLSDPLMLATVEYVLSVVNGGAVTFDTQIMAGIAGEAISSGQWVYFKESDGRWYLTDANTQASVKNVRIGMAKGAGTTGNAISGGVFVGGLEKTGTYVAGTTYYLSNTAGALATSAGEYEALVGIGDANGELLFLNIYDPEGTTPEEKDALAGSQGIPNSTNKFVTQDNITANGTDQSQTTQNGTIETGEADATTKKNLIAQSFIPSKTKIRGVKLYKSADTGSFVGTVTITLEANTTGSPSGTPLATRTLTNAEWLALSTGEFEAIFTSEYSSLVVGSLYWIVIDPSTSDNANHPNIGTNTAGGYSSGSAKYKNTADGWVLISTIDLYFKTLEGTASQIVKTGASGKIDEAMIDLNGFVGHISNTFQKLWFNAQLLFILWVGSSSGAATTDFPMWIRSSTDVQISGLGLTAQWGNAGQDTIYLLNPFHRNEAEMLQFNDSNTIIFDWFAIMGVTNTGTIAMGIGNDPNVMFRAYNDTNESSMRFVLTPAGVLYAVCTKASVGTTGTDISSGFVANKWNNFRIEVRLGVDVKFYINGVLKATMTAGANFNVANENIYFGFGRGDTATLAVSAPNVSMLMNP